MGVMIMDISDEPVLDLPLEQRLGALVALRRSLGDDDAAIMDYLMAEARRELHDPVEDEGDPDPTLIPTEVVLADFRAYLESDVVQSETVRGGNPTGALVQHLLALPPQERIRIASVIMQGFECGGIFPLSDDIIAESLRELEAHEADPSSSIPWEVVRAQLRAGDR